MFRRDIFQASPVSLVDKWLRWQLEIKLPIHWGSPSEFRSCAFIQASQKFEEARHHESLSSRLESIASSY